MTTQTKPKLTPTQAQAFNRYSATNASTIQSRLSCGCEPYKDVFTYNRWQALGYQVQRGEKSITIPVIVNIEDDNKEVTHKRLFRSHVFCRCQVKAMGNNQPVISHPIQPETKQPEIKPVAIRPEVKPQPEFIKPETDDIMSQWRIV